VVSTNFDVVHDQITQGENGLIAEMTPESVAEKIQELLDNESLRNKIIKNLERENNTTSTTEIQKFNKLIEA
jgi:glycosyltransferase involved in cell wall biosynthesis